MKISTRNILEYLKNVSIEQGSQKIKNDVSILETNVGEANVLFKVSINNKNYSVKVNALKKLRGYHRYEFKLLKALESTSLAPAAYIYESNYFDEPISILEFVVGDPCSQEWVIQNPDKIVGLINELHQTDPSMLKYYHFFGEATDAFDFALNILSYEGKQIRELEDFLKDNEIDVLWRRLSEDRTFLENCKGAFKMQSLYPTHLSVHRKNIIVTKDKPMLIDWQRGGLGDNALELYILFRKFGLINKEIILNDYCYKDDPLEERILVYERLFHLFDALWSITRVKAYDSGEVISMFSDYNPRKKYLTLFYEKMKELKE